MPRLVETFPVVLDLDGVVIDFDTHWRETAERVLSRPIVLTSKNYAFTLRYGLTQNEEMRVWSAYHDENKWESAPLFDYASKLISDLEGIGAEVWSITHVKSKLKPARVKSLMGLIPESRLITVYSEKSVGIVSSKVFALQTIAVRTGKRPIAFLEDNPNNANALMHAVSRSVLIDRGYEGLEPVEYGVAVIDDPMDFPVLVEEHLNRYGKTYGAII